MLLKILIKLVLLEEEPNEGQNNPAPTIKNVAVNNAATKNKVISESDTSWSISQWHHLLIHLLNAGTFLGTTVGTLTLTLALILPIQF